MIKKILFWQLSLSLILVFSAYQSAYSINLPLSLKDSVLVSDAQKSKIIIEYLASDELGGRIRGTRGDTLAIDYIKFYFKKLGLNTRVQEFNIQKDSSIGRNVYAILEGKSDKYLVFGAHYDHLGMGGRGSGSRMPDTVAVHNGADDNASGVAGVLLMADHYAKLHKEQLPEMGMIFTAFGAEEIGMLGSKALVANFPKDINKVVAMFNFDMIGNLRNGAISIGGTGTAKELNTIIDSAVMSFKDAECPLRVAKSTGGVGRSDHTSFYAKNIPVFFITTGATMDYHTPNDDAELLNYLGIDSVLSLTRLMANDVMVRGKLSFTEASSMDESNQKVSFKVSLGLMPDFTGEIRNGLRADVVIKGKPAHKAGMKNGDIIVKIDKYEVKEIHQYMEVLSKLKKGNTYTVKVKRGEEFVELNVEL